MSYKKTSIYPTAPLSDDIVDPVMAGNHFRMQKVDHFQQYIRGEQLRYRKSYKKTKRACTALKYTEYCFHIVDTALKGASLMYMPMLAISVPLSLGLQSATIGLSTSNNILAVKRQKFLQLLTLCTSKLDSITQHINNTAQHSTSQHGTA